MSDPSGWMLALNNGAVPHVDALDEQALADLLARCDFHVVVDDERGRGFVLGFASSSDHDGFNFRWFRDRYRDLLYIDRIVVDPSARGRGIGTRLYGEALAWCRANGARLLTCEVNERPPNPASHAFHRRLGFEPLESVEHPSGKTVRMYAMRVPASAEQGEGVSFRAAAEHEEGP